MLMKTHTASRPRLVNYVIQSDLTFKQIFLIIWYEFLAPVVILLHFFKGEFHVFNFKSRQFYLEFLIFQSKTKNLFACELFSNWIDNILWVSSDFRFMNYKINRGLRQQIDLFLTIKVLIQEFQIFRVSKICNKPQNVQFNDYISLKGSKIFTFDIKKAFETP